MNPALSASVSVVDLQYEPEGVERSKACLQVWIAFEESELNFGLSFPMASQTGEIQSTLDEGRKRLVHLFEAALNDLRRTPLRLK